MNFRSRWRDEPELDESGTPRAAKFGPLDLEICKLLAPTANIRAPWAYHYLPSSYFALLLNRGPQNTLRRLRKLSSKPNSYIRRPEQPRNNFRDLIYSLAPKGADEIREEGCSVPTARPRRLNHELMACTCAASFEYGASRHNLPITLADNHTSILPDWRPFTINGNTFFLEADVGSESLQSTNPDATSIAEKFSAYLQVINDGRLESTNVMFVTTRQGRAESMIKILKTVIDNKDLPHEHAAHFWFTHIEYDRFLNKIPKLTDWALTTNWQRAGHTSMSIVAEVARG